MAEQPWRNAVLERLAREAPKQFAALAAGLEPIALRRDDVLIPANRRAEWLYFVEHGIVSIVGRSRDGRTIELAMVGNDAVAGAAHALGPATMPFENVVQIPGMAYRIRTAAAVEQLQSDPRLHRALALAAQATVRQLGQATVCGRFHTAVQRLARWLLLTAERAETLNLPLTHMILAQMTGAPRSAVTVTAAHLREAGIIAYTRGVVRIRSVRRLQRAACECFAVLSRETLALQAAAPPRDRVEL